MSNQSFAAEQLLELLLQLKKTTPEAARSILNGQPQIAYALMTLMVTMNAVNFEVFQKTLAEYGSNSKSTPAPQPSSTHTVPPNAHPSASSTPVSALPPHMHPQPHPYRTGTPPSQPYPYSNGHQPVQAQSHPTYGQYNAPPAAGYGYNQPQTAYGGYSGYVSQPPPQNANVTDALANIGEEQKAFLMRVLSMTPEQVHALPPGDRQTYIQLRTHMGVAT